MINIVQDYTCITVHTCTHGSHTYPIFLWRVCCACFPGLTLHICKMHHLQKLSGQQSQFLSSSSSTVTVTTRKMAKGFKEKLTVHGTIHLMSSHTITTVTTDTVSFTLATWIKYTSSWLRLSLYVYVCVLCVNNHLPSSRFSILIFRIYVVSGQHRSFGACVHKRSHSSNQV